MKTKIKCICGKEHADGSKTLEDHSKKINKQLEKKGKVETIKVENNSQEESQIDASLIFINKQGKPVKVKDIITEKETWMINKRGDGKSIRILSHSAVQKIADIAGISKSYEVKESEQIIPKPENSMLHVVEITILCKSKPKIIDLADETESCAHDENSNKLRMTGEASKINTGRGGNYLRTMAEKRGYDRAVLRHLGLEGIYSEEEASAFDQPEQKIDVIDSEDIEKISISINMIINSQSIQDLAKVVVHIQSIKNTLNENQINYLRSLYAKKYSSFNQEF